MHRLLWLLVLPLLLVDCSKKDNPSTTSIDPTLTSIYDNVLSKNCVQCHAPGQSGTVAGAQVDFSSKSSSYSTLINQQVAGSSGVLNGNCTTVYLVVAGDPNSSYMLATLATDYHSDNFVKAGCSPYPPSGHGSTINSAELSAMVQWIQNGALNN